MINYKENNEILEKDIINLYTDVKWTSYLKDIPSLIKGIKSSFYYITAYDKEKLVGFIRVIGDGETIIYIQDILVLNEYQNQGIGTNLIEKVLNKFENVRQIVLITDDTLGTNNFYKKIGLKNINKLNMNCYIKIK